MEVVRDTIGVMKNGKWFTKTFFNFFFGFLAIIALAFGILLFAGSKTTPIDNIAGSQ